jgi:hypothetical protein
MNPLPTIRKRTTRVEFSARELALIDAAIFDAIVRLLADSKSFDISNPDDDDAHMEARMDAETLKGIQRKLDFAQKQIHLDSQA